ncbi:hypothetical protein ACEWY4_015252 [Coilia grayii]|uniref:Anillin homology domain-containing protein n=1 Tax=Coilia grayii TaxID=363190 RepID=A0ABD1JPU0_9TELE
MTSSARIHTHNTHRPRAQEKAACKGRVALSGLRIPLLWRDSDLFNNKGSPRCVAVFCLIILGRDVVDTEMLVVDRNTTDICFDGQNVFEGVESEFELRVELYSCAIEEAPPLSATPRKLANKLRSSLGKAGGRRLRPLIHSAGQEDFHDDFLHTHPLPPGVAFSLLAFTSLGLEQAGRDFLSHSFTITQTAESSSWLPLYASVCCRLLAQPDCMLMPTHTGPLCQQVCVEGVFRSCSLHCELQGASLSCWFSPEEVEAKLAPFLTLPVTTETCVKVQRDPHGPGHTMSIITPGSTHNSHVFRGHAPDLHEWAAAFSQHTHNLRSWKHCCEELMQIEVLSPRKPLFHSKQPETVYSDLSINSPCKFESVTDIIHNKIEETGGRFLIGQEEELEFPHWSALFEGSRPMLVQKVVMSPGKDPCLSSFSPIAHSNKKRSPIAQSNNKCSPDTHSNKKRSPIAQSNNKCSPDTQSNKKRSPIAQSNNKCSNKKRSPVTHADKKRSPIAHGNKKRKAPPPPTDKVPYTPPTPSGLYAPPTPSVSCSREKENICRSSLSHLENTRVPKVVPRSGRPSLDTKFSSVIQQLQKKSSTNRSAPQTNASTNGNPPLSLQQPPVPAPRHKLRKSFRQIMNSKPFGP